MIDVIYFKWSLNPILCLRYLNLFHLCPDTEKYHNDFFQSYLVELSIVKIPIRFNNNFSDMPVSKNTNIV